MPRKPKPPEKRKIAVPVNGRVIDVTMFPPTGNKSSWYAYGSDLTYSRTTGHSEFEEAVKAITDMLQNGGRKTSHKETLLTDDEFDEIQRRHYSKKKDPAARKRSARSLAACMEAVTAFRRISGLHPVSVATPEDCEKFQHEALKLCKDWRVNYADNPASRRRREKRGDVELLSPNTIVRWSVALKAAFERANRNAGKKCVRGVVPIEKLLTENPWKQFTWIEGREKPKRHFDYEELLSLLDYFQIHWPANHRASSGAMGNPERTLGSPRYS